MEASRPSVDLDGGRVRGGILSDDTLKDGHGSDNGVDVANTGQVKLEPFQTFPLVQHLAPHGLLKPRMG